MFFNTVTQSVIIARLNATLRYHNIPLHLNDDGICNGLASVYAKYVVEDKTDEFLARLEQVANWRAGAPLTSEMGHFIQEILVSFLPDQFAPRYNQMHSLEMLSIGHTPLKTSWQLGLCTQCSNWEAIFKTIALQEREALVLRSVNHTVSVSRREGKYLLYDPNYATGVKEFATEKALIRELAGTVFDYTMLPFGSSPLAMNVHLLQRPDATPRPLPTAIDIYMTYITPTTINLASASNGENLTTLEAACDLNDADAVESLLEQNATGDYKKLIFDAINKGNEKVISLLLKKYKPAAEELDNCFESALRRGRYAAFEALASFEMTKHGLKFYVKKNSYQAVSAAIEGGEVKLVTKILHFIETNRLFSDWQTEKVDLKLLIGTVRSGSVEILGVITDKLGITLDEKLAIALLPQAIARNRPMMVTHLLAKISPENTELGRLQLSDLTIHRTDLSILLELKERGVSFSPSAQLLIKEKEHTDLATGDGIQLLLLQLVIIIKQYLRHFNVNTGPAASYLPESPTAEEKPDVSPLTPLPLDDLTPEADESEADESSPESPRP